MCTKERDALEERERERESEVDTHKAPRKKFGDKRRPPEEYTLDVGHSPMAVTSPKSAHRPKDSRNSYNCSRSLASPWSRAVERERDSLTAFSRPFGRSSNSLREERGKQRYRHVIVVCVQRKRRKRVAAI